MHLLLFYSFIQYSTNKIKLLGIKIIILYINFLILYISHIMDMLFFGIFVDDSVVYMFTCIYIVNTLRQVHSLAFPKSFDFHACIWFCLSCEITFFLLSPKLWLNSWKCYNFEQNTHYEGNFRQHLEIISEFWCKVFVITLSLSNLKC